MKRLNLALVACSMAAVGACATSHAAMNPGTVPEVEREIRDLDQQWVAGIAAKDVTKATSFYAPDAILLPPNAQAASGLEAIKRGWGDMMRAPGVTLTFQPSTVGISPDGQVAYEVGTYAYGVDGPSGRVNDEGKTLVVWRKLEGKWKVVADMYNSNAAPPH